MKAAIIISCLLAVAQPSQPDSVEITQRSFRLYDYQWGTVKVTEYTVINNSDTPVVSWIDYNANAKLHRVSRVGCFKRHMNREYDSAAPDSSHFYFKRIGPGEKFMYIAYALSGYRRTSMKKHIFVEREERLVDAGISADLIEAYSFNEPYFILLNPKWCFTASARRNSQ